MDQLAPEFAVVAPALPPAEPPHFIEADVDHLSLAVLPAGDDRLRVLPVDALVGGVDGQCLGPRPKADYRLVPGKRAEVGPGLLVLRAGTPRSA